MSEKLNFYSNGKLLITGEYAVLDGALACAIPTIYGQSLEVKENKEDKIFWKAYRRDNSIWFETVIDLKNNRVEYSSNNNFSNNLLNILSRAQEIGKDFSILRKGYSCKTKLTFPENWGLGTSSTLISNISKWLAINPYCLLYETMGGSGYDLACADAKGAITFLKKDIHPQIKNGVISPEIKNNIAFVYLNNKQCSREEIFKYKDRKISRNFVDSISEISQNISKKDCSFNQFKELMIIHENLVSENIGKKKIKDSLFFDYPGFIKSLGAWGGDFIMVELLENTQEYFHSRGFDCIKKYSDLLL